MFKFFLLILLYVSQMSGAQSDGFRNLKWGENPTNDMIYLAQDSSRNIKVYTMKNDKKSIGEATITSIYYWYFDNKFMGVSLQCYGLGDYNSLKATLEAKFGPSISNQSPNDYMWSGGNTQVTMHYNNYNGEGEIKIMNNSLNMASEKYKTDIASKAAQDL